MRSLHSRQLGSTNWAFVITLILLLVFVWLWFQETDKHDKLVNDNKELKVQANNLNTEGVKLAEMLEELSKAVGWRSNSYTLQKIKRPGGVDAVVFSNAARITKEFSPDGVVPGAEDGTTQPGLLSRIITSAQVTFEREARLHTTKTGEEKTHSFSTLSTAFKEKLTSVGAQWAEIQFSRPVPPADPDDQSGKASYESDMQDYEQKVQQYRTALKELSETEGWSEFQKRIAAPGTWGDATKEGVTVHFYTYTDTGERTIEAALENLPVAFDRYGAELAANIQAAAASITQYRKDVVAKESEITRINGELTGEQEAHTNDVTQLQNSLNDSNERANRNAIAKTNAEQLMAKTKDDARKTEAGLRREVEARKEQNRLIKEKRDIVIARDDKDGMILAANSTLATATIDLGHSDKAFVGQKFVVSQLDRGGNRVNVGEIMVIRVTGPHSATARIINGAAPAGGNIHNPFYEPGETIYLYIAGKLDKWPLSMAKARLALLNCIVQDAPNGDTQYIVVPNSWAVVKKAAAGDEEDEGEDEGQVQANPLDQARKVARDVGANVITESLLDAFLDY